MGQEPGYKPIEALSVGIYFRFSCNFLTAPKKKKKNECLVSLKTIYSIEITKIIVGWKVLE